MSNFNHVKIRDLLLNGFSEQELRRLAQYQEPFRPLFAQMANLNSQADLVDLIMAFVEKKMLEPELLAWAKAHTSTRRFEAHGPYQTEPTDSAQPATADSAPPADSHNAKLIKIKERRLQKLKEQKAKFGLYTPPYIETEIDEIEAELSRLRGY